MAASVEQSNSTAVLARLEALEARVRELEDVRAINDVFRRWHRACTGGFNGIPTHRTLEGIDLLTDDATIEVQGLHEPGTGPTGREALLAYFKPYHGPEGLLPRVFQTGVDYGVTVDGDTAMQESNLIILTGYKNGAAAFSMSRYTQHLPAYRRGLEDHPDRPGAGVHGADRRSADGQAEYFASMPQ